MRRTLIIVSALLVVAPAARADMGDAGVAALQVGLAERGLYRGTVDGFLGTETVTATRRLQQRARIGVDGVPGPRTRSALGRYGRYELGRRTLGRGMTGWDVAALQFLLAWHGFPPGRFDGELGAHTETALRRFQRWARVSAEGLVGASTIAALRAPPTVSPIPLARPLALPLADGFGPRGRKFHAGVDIPAPYGLTVRAAASGRVVYAGWRDGGWGYEVTVAHASGVRTIYAHLSGVGTTLGERVIAGSALGQVGATGDATGPHLHFEVRLRGAAVDPVPALR